MLLKFAISDMLDDRRLKNISPITMGRYKLTLRNFQDFMTSEEIVDVEDITPNHIKKYILHCKEEKGNNPVTSNSKLRVLKTLFNYLVESEFITEKQNPVKRVQYAKEETRIDVFKENHIRQILAYYRRHKDKSKNFYFARAHCLVLVLLSTGLRVGEISNLTWDKLDLVNKQATVFGKLRVESSIPLADKTVKELIEWKLYLERCFRRQKLVYVFPTHKNKQWTDNGIKCLFKRLQKEMGFDDVRLSAHTFRHYYCHTLIKNGADAFTVQRLMRHSSMEMSRRYMALWGSELKEQNDKYNPINSLNIDY